MTRKNLLFKSSSVLSSSLAALLCATSLSIATTIFATTGSASALPNGSAKLSSASSLLQSATYPETVGNSQLGSLVSTSSSVSRPMTSLLNANSSLHPIGSLTMAQPANGHSDLRGAKSSSGQARQTNPKLVAPTLCPVINGTQVLATPVVTSVSPTTGPSTGGTQVTITGLNLGGYCESVAPNGASSTTVTQGGTTTTTTTVTSNVTTYQFTAYGVTFTSNSSTNPIVLGSPEILSDDGIQIVALTPPGPICNLISATTVAADIQVTQQTTTYTSIWIVTTPPGGSLPGGSFPSQPNPMTCVAAEGLTPPPSTCTSTSTSAAPTNDVSTSPNPVIFTYINQGPQVLNCGQNTIPYDIANGNAVTKQMAAELTADTNVERTSRGLNQLTTNQYLAQIADSWANEQAEGLVTCGGGGTTASVTCSDACILQEVAASGFTSGSSSLWAAENGGAFSGPVSTGQLNGVLVTTTSPEAVGVLKSLGNQPNCVTSSSGSGGGAGGGTGSGTGPTIAATSTSQNMLSTTFSQMGVGVACNGSSQGSCFVAEVFAGPGPLQPAVAPGAADISSGGTQAEDVLPSTPTQAKDSISELPGNQYVISGTWQPPPAAGFDPVNAYLIGITDLSTGIICTAIMGSNVLAFSYSGCIMSGNFVPFSTDSYSVSVSAVNDLCQTSCFPAALYPPAPPPGTGSTCDAFGDVFYPSCVPGDATPTGPNQLASPYIISVSGQSGNNGNPQPTIGPGDSYRLVAADGGVFSFGQDNFYGSMGGQVISGSMVAIAATPDGGGYWTCSSGGGVYAFGDANFYGSTGGMTLASPIIAFASTPDGGGYWMAGADGGVFAFGDAQFLGSLAGKRLNGPVESFAVTPDGKGYWMVTSQGTVYAFGDASLFGSIPAGSPHTTIVGIARTLDGRGYWLASSDGSVYAFGDAIFYGNAVGSSGSSAIIGIFATQTGKGYWLLTQSGGLVTFGDATFSGSVQNLDLAAPVVSMEVG